MRAVLQLRGPPINCDASRSPPEASGLRPEASREARARYPRSMGPEAHAKPIREGALLAVLAAIAFGVTTPLVRRFGEGVSPFATAPLLYAGAAIASLPTGPASAREAQVRRAHLPRLVLVAALGAFVAPACLAWGLQRTSGSVASLLLNVEAVFTVLLARRIHREPIGGRVAAAVVLMALGGGCLVLEGFQGGRVGWGAIAVVAATLGWALDNTLTRPLASLDPTAVVRAKSAIGAALSFLLAWTAPFPPLRSAVALLACGAVGYGLSLRLYLLAQRRIGAARTGSVFAVAPFLGAATAFAMGERAAGLLTWVGALLFAVALVLHLTERHGHRHTHERLVHEHAHRHDDGHHDHVHDPPVEGVHSHEHVHTARTHEHPHAPDEHHRHAH